MSITCHILVEQNPGLLYVSRNGAPEKVLPKLERFLVKFWDERETAGEHRYTPECLLAQVTVRFGFESCEDDFSNLRVGVDYDPDVEYIYLISLDKTVTVWAPEPRYRQKPQLGLDGCHQLKELSFQTA
ncbi:MAG: histidine kinase [Sodalinema sp.]|uniref:histidine kinase n=1 Tax=Sodalinema sp. TaxID=3080550 RepID=UPI001215173B|nr:MAG: histidine kinase [Phormidium sp. SL48-SHIP]